MDRYIDVYNIVAYKHVIQTYTCLKVYYVNNDHFPYAIVFLLKIQHLFFFGTIMAFPEYSARVVKYVYMLYLGSTIARKWLDDENSP